MEKDYTSWYLEALLENPYIKEQLVHNIQKREE
jgi:hypothetical protein